MEFGIFNLMGSRDPEKPTAEWVGVAKQGLLFCERDGVPLRAAPKRELAETTGRPRRDRVRAGLRFDGLRRKMLSSPGDRGFESGSLHQRVLLRT
jgi:hypothetical protein